MAAIFSMYKHWADMILSGEKPFEFRMKQPQYLNLNDTIYLYETKSRGGCGMVVGECSVDRILHIEHHPLATESLMLRYWYEYVKKEPIPEGVSFLTIENEFIAWLNSIGYCNKLGVTNYRYLIYVKNPIRYNSPKPITLFSENSRPVKVPQSFCYCEDLKN